MGQLVVKRMDGSVGSPLIEGTRLADQSRKHPFAQLKSLSLNIYFNSHRFHAHFLLSVSVLKASYRRRHIQDHGQAETTG
jgi:hypothetical protein